MRPLAFRHGRALAQSLRRLYSPMLRPLVVGHILSVPALPDRSECPEASWLDLWSAELPVDRAGLAACGSSEISRLSSTRFPSTWLQWTEVLSTWDWAETPSLVLSRWARLIAEKRGSHLRECAGPLLALFSLHPFRGPTTERFCTQSLRTRQYHT